MVTIINEINFSILIVMLTTARHNPGPGAYEPKTSISANGSYMIAGYKNSKAPTFSAPSAKGTGSGGRNSSSPGPGAYNLKVGISDNAS